MADKKITQDSNLPAPAVGDLIPIVDIDAAAASMNKNVTWAQIMPEELHGEYFEQNTTPVGAVDGSLWYDTT